MQFRASIASWKQPVKYIDPDGRALNFIVGAAVSIPGGMIILKAKARVDYNGRTPFVSIETLVQFKTLRVIQSKEIEISNRFVPRSSTNTNKHQRMH